MVSPAITKTYFWLPSSNSSILAPFAILVSIQAIQSLAHTFESFLLFSSAKLLSFLFSLHFECSRLLTIWSSLRVVIRKLAYRIRRKFRPRMRSASCHLPIFELAWFGFKLNMNLMKQRQKMIFNKLILPTLKMNPKLDCTVDNIWTVHFTG